jgi:hypothetical protein
MSEASAKVFQRCPPQAGSRQARSPYRVATGIHRRDRVAAVQGPSGAKHDESGAAFRPRHEISAALTDLFGLPLTPIPAPKEGPRNIGRGIERGSLRLNDGDGNGDAGIVLPAAASDRGENIRTVGSDVDPPIAIVISRPIRKPRCRCVRLPELGLQTSSRASAVLAIDSSVIRTTVEVKFVMS